MLLSSVENHESVYKCHFAVKKNNLLAEIPLEPAEVEEFKQHVYEDLNRQFEEIKEVNIPICHVLSKLYEEETAFKVLIDNYAQIS